MLVNMKVSFGLKLKSREKKWNRNKERNIGGIFFSAINVGEVFCYDVEDKI